MTTIKNLGKEKTAVLLSVLTVLILGMSVVLANSPAVVIKDGLCGVIGPNGEFFTTQDSHIVISNDKNGNRKITCHGTLPGYINPPTKAVHWDYESLGKLCNIGSGSTENWKAVITPSGKVMLSCHINPSE